eukprot:11532075-Karenia_brevis.AAC.1
MFNAAISAQMKSWQWQWAWSTRSDQLQCSHLGVRAGCAVLQSVADVMQSALMRPSQRARRVCNSSGHVRHYVTSWQLSGTEQFSRSDNGIHDTDRWA